MRVTSLTSLTSLIFTVSYPLSLFVIVVGQGDTPPRPLPPRAASRVEPPVAELGAEPALVPRPQVLLEAPIGPRLEQRPRRHPVLRADHAAVLQEPAQVIGLRPVLTG